MPPFHNTILAKHPELRGIDLDAHAEAVFSSAQRIFKQIKEKRAALDANGQDDKPLFIFIGEVHSYTADTIFLLAFLTLLKKSNWPFIYGAEVHHNCLRTSFAKAANSKDNDVEYNEFLLRLLIKADINSCGRLSLLNWLFFTRVNDSYIANRNLKHFLAASKTPTVLADVAQNRLARYQGWIDTSDTLSAESIRDCMGYIPQHGIPTTQSSLGRYIRNRHMVKMLINNIQSDTRVVLLYVGAAHLFDFPVSGLRAQTSLSSICEEVGYPYVNILCRHDDGKFGKKFLEDEGKWQTEDFLHTDSLPTVVSIYNAYKNEPLPNTPKNVRIQNQEAEDYYVRGVSCHPDWEESIGLGNHILTLRKMSKMAEIFGTKLTKTYKGQIEPESLLNFSNTLNGPR